MAVNILVTPEVEKVLESEGRSGGLPKYVQNQLIKKLAEIAGNVEDKGGAGGVKFWGINLPDGYRTAFTFNEAHQPVLVYAGDHDGYMRLKLAEKTPSDFPVEAAKPAELTSPKAVKNVSIDEFNKEFSKTATGFPADPVPYAPPPPPPKPGPDDIAAKALLDTDREKFALRDGDGNRYVYDADTETLLTIKRDGSKSLLYGADAEAEFGRQQTRFGTEAAVVSGKDASRIASGMEPVQPTPGAAPAKPPATGTDIPPPAAEVAAAESSALANSKFSPPPVAAELEGAEAAAGGGAKTGIIVGAITGGAVAVYTLAKGGTAGQALEAGVVTAVPYANVVDDLARGNTEAAKKDATVTTGGVLGGIAGGAALGAALGIETGPGAIATGIVGGIAGGFVGAEGVKRIYENVENSNIAEGLKEGAKLGMEAAPAAGIFAPAVIATGAVAGAVLGNDGMKKVEEKAREAKKIAVGVVHKAEEKAKALETAATKKVNALEASASSAMTDLGKYASDKTHSAISTIENAGANFYTTVSDVKASAASTLDHAATTFSDTLSSATSSVTHFFGFGSDDPPPKKAVASTRPTQPPGPVI